MGVRGKRYRDRIITTYSDYGNLNGKNIMSRHFSDQAAANAWKKIVLWYGPNCRVANYMSWRVWQVDHRTDKIINDTGNYGHKNFSNYQSAPA